MGAGREAYAMQMELLAPLVGRGDMIPFCDHRYPPNVPEQDYLFYLDLKPDLFVAAWCRGLCHHSEIG